MITRHSIAAAARFGAAGAVAALLAACSGSGINAVPGRQAAVPAAANQAEQSGAATAAVAAKFLNPDRHYAFVRACPEQTGVARCELIVRKDLDNTRAVTSPKTSTEQGYGPQTFWEAYSLPSTVAGAGQTVAIVDVGDDPDAASDLAYYRSYWGLPACSTCLTKVSQTGSTTALPPPNSSWIGEEAEDTEAVAAICPLCHIILVEANTGTTLAAQIANFQIAENEAVALGAKYVSNSYTFGEETAASNSAYAHPGVVIVAASGDHGYGVGPSQPCSYATVVCAGGTSLVPDSAVARGYIEEVWNQGWNGPVAGEPWAAGSSCSAVVPKPAWQNDTGCKKRSTADVSFDADPRSGFWAYTAYEGTDWFVTGGTSLASPSTAAIFALANGSSLGESAAASFWTDRGANLNSVVLGNNLLTGLPVCPAAYEYICTAGTGADGSYSGPGGWGTPNGAAAY